MKFAISLHENKTDNQRWLFVAESTDILNPKESFLNTNFSQVLKSFSVVNNNDYVDQYLNYFLNIGLNKDNAIVIDYGGKPVVKIREALKGYPYHGNLCAAVINHANSVGKKLQDDIKQLIQKV